MNSHKTKLAIPLIVALVAIIAFFAIIIPKTDVNDAGAILPDTVTTPITSFEQCVAAGNPVMESYPRQCRAGDTTFVEDILGIPGSADVIDQIRVSTPIVNETVSSPIKIQGEARGNWFFEATFPVILTNWDGLIIAEGYATAQGEWMTTDFVPFTATLTYKNPDFNNRGFLILRKANASGLPEHDASVEIPIYFKGVAPQNQGSTDPNNTGGAGNQSGNPDNQVMCTADAKMCPDGSYVGRVAPSCSFAPCPGN